MYKVLVGKPEGYEISAEPKPRLEDNIEMDYKDVELGYGLVS
jgi:hypothetical protein